jgi:molybdopterin-containing oxidoreductase family iron-sulfur binding subunit
MPPLNDAPLTPWRSLQELESDPAFEAAIQREFPQGASVWSELDNDVSRRRFLQLLGASAALAGISACTKMPAERIIPYVVQPEKLIPGKPGFYATSMSFGGFSKGLLAESHEGRPTKLEGNPRHPGTLGKSDIFAQAELLSLYDPDRAQTVLDLGETATWDRFIARMASEESQWSANGGEGVRILSHRITSPTLLGQLGIFFKRYPNARWHAYEPAEGGELEAATELAFGRALRPLYDFARATLVLSLDNDFLGPGPAQEIYARDFMARRRTGSLGALDSFNRLYVIESSVGATGACADQRWPVKPSELHGYALALAAELGVPGIPKPDPARPPLPDWLAEIASDLKAHAGDCLVLAGERLAPETQAVTFAINEHLGNIGKSLRFIAAQDAGGTTPATIAELTQDMGRRKVQTLFILGANPVYDTPASLEFEKLLAQVPLRVRLGLYHDETAFHCHWSLPQSHFLESWGDGRALDGTITLQQPLIAPMYETRSSIELLSILLGQAGRTGRQALEERLHLGSGSAFERALSDGYLPGSASNAVTVKTKPGGSERLRAKNATTARADSGSVTLEAVIRPDPTIWDGRYANNGWLQELPKPLLQLTWSNAVLLSPATAERLRLTDEDEIEIKSWGRTARAAVLRAPGHPNDSATLFLGYGRSKAGRVGNQLGYDAYGLQDHRSPWLIPSLEIRKLGTQVPLALTHAHSSMEGRDLIVHAELAQLMRAPESVVKESLRKKPSTLLPDRPSPPGSVEAWAMVIDLSVCIGCNACAIACQAENNIPVVGSEEVRRSREMHWIRVDRYFDGTAANPKTYFQPVPCMHCEKAPCEEVCPTAATNHSLDGLNQMIYNRCVGTRYCSNNCPYKVRRFNFFQYADIKSATAQLMHNPDVTVRSRGVMEKCTYCIQRIQAARIGAELESRPIRDGEILTACQQACPTDAIVFGDQSDSRSRVSALRARSHNYSLLNELGTLPRTTYLAAIRNPNPKIAGGPA